MSDLSVLADHLDAFDLNLLERAEIFHAYDLAPNEPTFTPHMALTYAKTSAQAAWRQARTIPLRKIGETFGQQFMFHVPNAYGATKLEILYGLAKARDML